MPKKAKNAMVNYSVRLHRDEWEALSAEAEKYLWVPSKLIRVIVQDWLKMRGNAAAAGGRWEKLKKSDITSD